MRSVGLTNFGALLATGGRTDSEGRRRCVLQTHSVTPNRILEISYAFWQSKALLSAVELDVFTVLAGPSRRSQTPKQKSGDSAGRSKGGHS